MKVQLIIGLMIFLLIGSICSADNYVGGIPPVTIQQSEISGGVFCDSYYYDENIPEQDNYNPITIEKNFTLPSYTDIEWAMLMVDVYCGHMENNYPGWANVTFNDIVKGNESLNVPFTLKANSGSGYVIIGDHMNRVSSDYLMWYNVTDLIRPGNNTAIVHTEEQDDTLDIFDGRIIHITLVVAYNDSSGNTIYYCVNRGHDVDSYFLQSPPDYIGSTDFIANIPTDKIVSDSTLTVVHRSSTDGTYTFNSGSISSGTPQGTYSGTNVWDVTSSFTQDGTNTLTYDRAANFYKIQLGVLTADYQGDPSDLRVADINAHHFDILHPPYFNLSNEVNITVENIGSGAAGSSKVSLYADDVFIGKTDVPALAPSSSATVQIMWTPLGTDCQDGGSSTAYTLKAIADCDNELIESNEGNNESTASETAYWIGYHADEHLTAVLQGTIHGGLYYTTGNGRYIGGGLHEGDSVATSFDDIGTSIPSGADIALARLNIYFCWSHYTNNDTGLDPLMEVSITNNTGTYVLTSAAKYTDRPCLSPGVGYDYPYGNYVYDIADYVKGENTVTVTVKNLASNTMFAPSAPGIVILYEDETKPEYDYWLIEGADLLQGGRRSGSGCLSLSECTCNATFTGSTSSVETATLGIVNPWGGGSSGFESYPSYYWFNSNYLGDNSTLGGYSSAYSRTVNNMTMYVNVAGSPAQVGVNISDVTGYIVSQDNTVSFVDGGDSMMPANAFLLVESGGVCGDVNGNGEVNMGDVTLLSNHVGYPSNPDYAVNSFAADVNGNGEVNMGDVTLLSNHVGYPSNPDYEITC